MDFWTIFPAFSWTWDQVTRPLPSLSLADILTALAAARAKVRSRFRCSCSRFLFFIRLWCAAWILWWSTCRLMQSQIYLRSDKAAFVFLHTRDWQEWSQLCGHKLHQWHSCFWSLGKKQREWIGNKSRTWSYLVVQNGFVLARSSTNHRER